MIGIAASGGVTNDGAVIIDGQPPGTGPAKRAKVNHLPVVSRKRGPYHRRDNACPAI